MLPPLIIRTSLILFQFLESFLDACKAEDLVTPIFRWELLTFYNFFVDLQD